MIPATIYNRLTEAEDGCWEWNGYRDYLGYGQVRINWKCYYVHIIVYESLVGLVPMGLELDHVCRNPACARPSHLEPVTHRTNLLRGNGASGKNKRKTHCIHGHEFTPDNIYEPPKKPGTRHCRACAKRIHDEQNIKHRKEVA